VEALAAGDGQFRLVGSAPRGETIRFKRGEIVECEIRTLSDGSKGLVAIRSVSDDPEYRSRQRIFAMCGVIVGGLLGAGAAFLIETSFETRVSLVLPGLVLGAIAFGFASARWGDAAWSALSRVLQWM